jgi:hypothetical protein
MGRRCGLPKGERKCCFIKNNMAGHGDPVGGEIETPIALVVGGVTDEDTQG